MAGLISPGMAEFFALAARTFVLSSSDTGQLGLGLGSVPVSGVAGLRQSAAIS